jgi:hypothetical protein
MGDDADGLAGRGSGADQQDHDRDWQGDALREAAGGLRVITFEAPGQQERPELEVPQHSVRRQDGDGNE